jgi:hypothetical protein
VPGPAGKACASHYHPLMGLYDSGDPQATDCHVLLMKLAGIDGVLIDWYGDRKQYDYLNNDRHTEVMIHSIQKAGMKFALVYEDQTVSHLIEGGVFKKEDALSEGVKLMKRTQDRWFGLPSYLKWGSRPLLLVFGPDYYHTPDWHAMLDVLTPPPAYFSVHFQHEPATGSFDWPLPQGGTSGCLAATEAFYKRSASVPSIPVAYPRFHDYYAEAGVGKSYGTVDDLGGKLYTDTLSRALHSGAPVVQIATWNDWGEGTIIEPSVEFGYRELETTQRLRHSSYRPADLRLPVQLYLLQKAHAGDAKFEAKLDGVSGLLFAGKVLEARRRLDHLGK